MAFLYSFGRVIFNTASERDAAGSFPDGQRCVCLDTGKQFEIMTNVWMEVSLGGTMTGDQIKSALGISTLSGSNTGDQDISGKVDKITGKGLSTNDYTTAEQTKLSGIATGATVGADWNTNIANKPTIPAAQVQTDWNASSGMGQLLNKPTIPAAQVQTDWNASSGMGQLLNKPTISGSNTGDQTGGTPAIVLGTANTAGSSPNFLRRDDTILAFDATAPTTQAFGDSAVVGSATVASRRDHKHAMPSTVVIAGAITSSGAGIGYASGAGGTVTQSSSKATGVTLSKLCGTITMNGAALAAATTVSFTLTNTFVAATDFVDVQHASVGTLGAYTFAVAPAAGSVVISVRNVHTASLSEAIVIQFVIIKATTS